LYFADGRFSWVILKKRKKRKEKKRKEKKKKTLMGGWASVKNVRCQFPTVMKDRSFLPFNFDGIGPIFLFQRSKKKVIRMLLVCKLCLAFI
jgi:hypothetical protein